MTRITKSIYKTLRCYILSLPRSPPPAAPIFTKFDLGAYLPDVIIYSQFHINHWRGFWFCEGLNFAISDRKTWSPLTRCLHYRASRDVWQCISTCVCCVQRVQPIRSSVRVLECVFRHVSCVMATHSVVTTVTKSTVLTITVSFSSNFHA